MLLGSIRAPTNGGLFKNCRKRKNWEARFWRAKKLARKTDNFSDAWVKSAARTYLADIARCTWMEEWKEAERRRNTSKLEAEYEEIAADVSKHCGVDAAEVARILREADKLPWRLLEAAKQIKMEMRK